MPGAEEAERRGNISKLIEEEIGARLSGEERMLLRMASVFRYPVPAEAIFRNEGITYDVMDGLVARSLLRESTGGSFDIHDFVRDFFYSRMTPRERAALHLEASRYYSGLEGTRPRLELMHHLLKAGEHGRAAEFKAMVDTDLYKIHDLWFQDEIGVFGSFIFFKLRGVKL